MTPSEQWNNLVVKTRHLSRNTHVRVNSNFRPSLWLEKGLEFSYVGILACARTDVFIKFDLYVAVSVGFSQVTYRTLLGISKSYPFT